MAGQNDLNMLLKAQVVKIRAELDVKGSLPRIKEQIKEISKRLEKNPIKLQVKLDYKISELTKQMRLLQTSLDTAKTLKPIKIKVEVDVKGSATQIKKQLQEVNRVVDEFNKKYGEQVKKMQEQVNKYNQVIGGAGQSGKRSSNSMTYQMIDEIREAEKALRQMYSSKTGSGLFGFSEFRDAEGNVKGFVAQLEKANGVVHKIRYEWNKDAGKFTPITQETVDATQKHVHKATQSLRSLSAEIQKLQDSKGKDTLWSFYDDLERRAGQGTLTNDAVKDLQRQIKEEQVLQQQIDKTNKEYIEREKLIYKIKKARDEEWKKTYDIENRRKYNQLINDVQTNPKDIAKYRLELDRLIDAEKKRAKTQQESLTIEQKRAKVLRELNKLDATISPVNKDAKVLIEQTRGMLNYVRTADDFIKVQKNMAKIADEYDTIKLARKAGDYELKIRKVLQRLVQTGDMSVSEYEKIMKRLPKETQANLGELERVYRMYNQRLDDAMSQSFLNRGKTLDTKGLNIEELVSRRDTDRLKEYISQVYGMRVATIGYKDVADSTRGTVRKLEVAFESKGKTLKTVGLEYDKTAKKLRELQNVETYNPNRNLGIFEQLKIAMERVPVWMASMTAFYGSIRSVQAMSREILQVDKALTELRRVASDDIQIDKIFKSAVDMSRQLGNNVHDVMQTLNDFSRTFGEFNERQLLAITNTATLMSNVSELSSIEAGETLIATMNAFNIEAEESIRIVDAFNEVDNNFAVSTKQLAEGMSKTASTAKTFGKVICRLAW